MEGVEARWGELRYHTAGGSTTRLRVAQPGSNNVAFSVRVALSRGQLRYHTAGGSTTRLRVAQPITLLFRSELRCPGGSCATTRPAVAQLAPRSPCPKWETLGTQGYRGRCFRNSWCAQSVENRKEGGGAAWNFSVARSSLRGWVSNLESSPRSTIWSRPKNY